MPRIRPAGITPAVANASYLPQTVSWSCSTLPTETNGTVVRGSLSGGMGATRIYGDAVGAYYGWTVGPVAAGTYRLETCYPKNSDDGILTISIDGVDLSPTIDEYNGSPMVNNFIVHTGIALAAGRHTIRYTVTGKNASSSAYYGVVQGTITLQRTGA